MRSDWPRGVFAWEYVYMVVWRKVYTPNIADHQIFKIKVLIGQLRKAIVKLML